MFFLVSDLRVNAKSTATASPSMFKLRLTRWFALFTLGFASTQNRSCLTAVQAFAFRPRAVTSERQSSASSALFSSHDDEHDGERKGDPARCRRNSTSTVFTNDRYIPPIKVVPVRASTSPSSHSKTGTTTEYSKEDDSLLSLQSNDGGQYLVEIGDNIQQAAQQQKQDYNLPAASKRLLQEAGKTISEMSVAWNSRDWEAVTYAALDASQTMKLVAQSLNRFHCKKTSSLSNNKLQQAYAGIAVELRVLSSIRHNDKQAQAILDAFQGLSLRLSQAAKHSLHNDDESATAIHYHLASASQAAKRLAQTYYSSASATSAVSFSFSLRQLWWHARARRRIPPRSARGRVDDNVNDQAWE